MKTLNLFSLLLIVGLFTIVNKKAEAQVVYVTQWRSDADKVVYVSEWESDANMIVYKTNYKAEAKSDSGLWYFTDFEAEADLKIYFTTWRNEADLVIYFTDWKGDAGWIKKEE